MIYLNGESFLEVWVERERGLQEFVLQLLQTSQLGLPPRTHPDKIREHTHIHLIWGLGSG